MPLHLFRLDHHVNPFCEGTFPTEAPTAPISIIADRLPSKAPKSLIYNAHRVAASTERRIARSTVVSSDDDRADADRGFPHTAQNRSSDEN